MAQGVSGIGNGIFDRVGKGMKMFISGEGAVE